jgi:hypothetical protein
MLHERIKGGESGQQIHITHSLSSCADPSHPFYFLFTTACCNGVQPSPLPLLHIGPPCGAEAGAWMVDARVRGLAALWRCSSLEPPARELVFFARYAAVDLMPLVPLFLLTVLEFKGV